MHKIRVFLSSKAIAKIEGLQKNDETFSDALEKFIVKPVKKKK